MIWLNARTTHAHCWVGHKEVANGDVWGNWKRFSYRCNGHRQHIYCRTQKVFFELFFAWQKWASIWAKNYNYTIEDYQEVIMDNPDSRPFRVKSWIWSQLGEYIQ